MVDQELVRQVGIAFECSDDIYLEERVVISGTDMSVVLAEANVFGKHAEFGRRYLGLTGYVARLEDAMEGVDETTLLTVRQVDEAPHLVGDALADFLEKWELDSIPTVDEYDQIDALPASFEKVRWWEERTAFGHGTPLAVDLKRCCATDSAFAGSAAFATLDAIHHQGSLHPAAPTVLPFLVDLISDERVTCRRVLSSGLVQIAQTVAEVPDRGKVVEMFERIGSGILALPPLGRTELVNALQRHVTAARSIRDKWPRLAVRLADVADDPALGKNIRRALDALD